MDWNNRILVIDDQPNIHEDFNLVLHEPRHNVEAQTIEHALFDDEEEAETLPVEPDQFLQGQANYRIDHANNGQAGINMAAAAHQNGKPYAVIFVDVRMPPGIDGVETARAILTICPMTEVVIISAFSDYTWEGMIDKLKAGGRFHFLGKPFNRLSLRQMAFNCTLKWNQERVHLNEQVALIRERDYFQRALTHAGTVILEEDFSAVLEAFDRLREKGVTNLSAYLRRKRRATANLADMVVIRQISSPAGVDAPFDAKPGARLSEILNAESLPIFKKQLCRLWEGENRFEGSLTRKNRFGDPVEVRMSMLVSDPDNRPGQVTVSLTARPRKKEDYLTDPLTGMANRQLFDIHLDQAFKEFSRARGAASGEPENNRFGLLFMDLNDFKKINDDYGHQIGDQLLQAFAKRLQNTCRDVDIVSRRGGDEFTLLVRGLQAYGNLNSILAGIQKALAEPTQAGDYHGPLSASIGCAVCPDDTEDPNQLVRYADLAMYQAKRGSNATFRTAQWADLTRESDLLAEALDKSQLELRYELIYTMDGRPLGGQAVPMVNHPEKGLTPAGNLIGLAGLTGQMDPVCQWIFEMLSSTICMLQLQELPATLFLNLGGAPLQDPTLVIRLETILQMKNLDPSSIVLEFPEEALAREEKPGPTLEAVKRRGFRTCLSDHNPASGPWAIYRFPFDVIKIREARLVKDVGRQDQQLYLGVLSLIARNKPDLWLIGDEITESAYKALLEEYGFHGLQGPLVSDTKPLDSFMHGLTQQQFQEDMGSLMPSTPINH